MTTEELTALGLNEDQIKGVFALYGKGVNAEKKNLEALIAERDDLKARLEDANEAVKRFDGIDPDALKGEVEKYRQQAEAAAKNFEAQMRARDQRAWLTEQLGAKGITSPYARRALIDEAMGEHGLRWNDGAFEGFDGFIAAAVEKDASLLPVKTEEKGEDKLRIVGSTGSEPAAVTKKTIPRLF